MFAELGVLSSQATLRMELLTLIEEGLGGIRLNKTEHLCEIQNLVFIDTSRCTSFLLYGCCLYIFKGFQYWRPISPNQRIVPCRSILHTRFMAAKSLSKSLLKGFERFAPFLPWRPLLLNTVCDCVR